ncbi:MAG: GtrA family protein [Thermoplasmata archaeon]
MAASGGMPERASSETQSPGERYLRYGAAWAAGALPALAVVTALWLYPTAFEEVGGISLGAFALMFPVAVRRLRVERSGEFVSFLLLAGVGFGVVSILTGAANGLTDQAYTTPRYVTLLFAHHDPYVVLLSFSYQQYGTTFTSQSTFSNLPLLMFLQVPGLSYKWFALACWAGMAFLARRRFDAGVMLAQPYMVIVAASGFDDLVVLLLLTLGFLGFEGRRQKWAEWLALGCKQFANVFVVAYYVIHRDWRKTAVTLGISLAFLAPFLLWSGSAVLCPIAIGAALPACSRSGAFGLQFDYSVWVVWALALFYVPFIQAVQRRASGGVIARWLRRFRLTFEDLLRIPAFLVVGVSGVFVNLCVFTLIDFRLGDVAGSYLLASAGAFVVAMGWNFSWNRAWAFAGRGDRSTAYHLAVYGTIQAGVLAVNLLVLAIAVDLGGSPLDSQLIGILVGSGLGYAANLRWNFRAPARGAAT